ncbi:MAG: DUF4445 domain-containing protein [Chloroflexi bacterium]|nr:DUF4445 domain-containing protein [Chloroflexota bacterium]
MKVRFEPFGVTTQVEAGATLLQAAQAAGVEIESVCGGRGTCGKCKVIATSGLSPLTELEQHSLSADELGRGYRLACQATVQGDVDVVVPDESRIARVSILSEGVQRQLVLEPWAHRQTLQVPSSSLEEQSPDLEMVARALKAAHKRVPGFSLRALQQLPGALRAQNGQITLIQVDEQVVRVEPGEGPARLLGIAFDIGTTTVVGYLHDLETGAQLAVSSLLNPQTRYGDDVVSRIEYASRSSETLATLQQEVVGALNTIIANTTHSAGMRATDIEALTVVGNTTMQHLLLGINPSALAQAPYVPVTSDAARVRAADLGISADPEALLWVLPNIAGWVGGDTVGVILSTGAHLQEHPALALDIGTNGEMAMGSRERLVTCSTAAGPAFEGAHLSCGMRAADGAVDRVSIDGDVHWHTIGNSAPRGLCGSGLVDLVAQMLRAGIIDNTGMMRSAEDLRSDGHEPLAARIVQENGRRLFLLASAAEGAGGHAVRVSQRDVRELQLAKGAIRAGIEILLSELGLKHEDVRTVFMAGAFGNYISPESALAIGLIPRFPNAEIVPVGNAAGSGAKMALLSLSARKEASRIQHETDYLELSGRTDFQEQFADAMVFA